ncbi:MAG: hypothetical protein WCJ58_01175 [bacterium]
MKNKIIITKEIQPRIHVKTLTGESIFGSLNIERLTKSDEEGVYLMSDGVPVTCDKEMLARINERLDFLNWGK